MVCFLGSGLSILKKRQVRRFDPKMADQQARIAIGRSRAVTRAEFEKMQQEDKRREKRRTVMAVLEVRSSLSAAGQVSLVDYKAVFGGVEEVVMRWVEIVTVVVGLSIMQPARSDDPKGNDALQGTWLASAAELGGKPFPDEVCKSIKLTLKGDTYTVTVGKNLDKGTVRLDPSAKPKAMDITGTEGPNKGKKIPAIYALDGDTLKVCYDLTGRKRPTELKTSQGTPLFLVTYKRAKP